MIAVSRMMGILVWCHPAQLQFFRWSLFCMNQLKNYIPLPFHGWSVEDLIARNIYFNNMIVVSRTVGILVWCHPALLQFFPLKSVWHELIEKLHSLPFHGWSVGDLIARNINFSNMIVVSWKMSVQFWSVIWRFNGRSKQAMGSICILCQLYSDIGALDERKEKKFAFCTSNDTNGTSQCRITNIDFVYRLARHCFVGKER